VHIIQVGANKGNTDNDPVWKLCQENMPASLDWKIDLIEPNPKAVEICRENYRVAGFTNVVVFCCGISDTHEELDLFIDNDVPGNEGSQHASMNRSHLHKLGHSDQVISTRRVTCYPLHEFFHESVVDILQIDTEGYDAKVLLGCDFTGLTIKKIQFEHIHISPEEFAAVVSKLEEIGYKRTYFGPEDVVYELN